MTQRTPPLTGCVITQQDASECRHVVIRFDSSGLATQQPSSRCAAVRKAVAHEYGSTTIGIASTHYMSSCDVLAVSIAAFGWRTGECVVQDVRAGLQSVAPARGVMSQASTRRGDLYRRCATPLVILPGYPR
jgi:hypothetical protein